MSNIFSHIETTTASADYELLDSGEGEKLERFGAYVLRRPDPQALWHKRLDLAEWKKAHATFTNTWNLKKDLPAKWLMDFAGLKFVIRPSSFKHVGIFPEQSTNWEWVRRTILSVLKTSDRECEVLNLFGYTGGASLAALQAGAKVVHVDGSKVALTWARESAEASGLEKKPIRWILDDAHAFVKREIKRGRKYEGIIMDPPAFGHGPKNELWKIEEHLLPLIDDCAKILADKPFFFLINGYSAGYSAVAYENVLKPLVQKYGGSIQMGELTVEESTAKQSGVMNESRRLPCGIFARWSQKDK